MKFVLLKHYNSINVAEMSKRHLATSGIVATIQNSGVQFPGDLGDAYGADLLVSENNLHRAMEILNISKEERSK